MNKKYKIITMLFVAAMLTFSIGGCKKEEAETTTTQSGTSIGQMEGTLVSFSGSSLTLKDAKSEYTFDISTATVKAANMVAGDDIVIHYEGELSGTDTSGAKVTAVEDKGGAPTEQEEKQAVGTLVDISMNTITIKQNDGTLLTFNSNNCEHDFKNGIREGNWIVVTYIGDINGTDTQSVKVVKITDDDPNTVEAEQQQMNIKAVDETVYATAGVHIRASYSTDSDVVGNLAKGDSIKRTGICDNGWSRVQYNNADAYIYGEYLTTTAPAADAPAATTSGTEPNTPQQGNDPEPVQDPASQPQDQQQTIDGIVEEASMNTLSFTANDQIYTVNIADAQHQYANGIQTGNRVTVTYIGDLNTPESVVVISVVDTDPNTAAVASVFTGTVVDGTMNTLTIQTDDGTDMTFDKSQADDETGGIEIGAVVSVTADVNATDTTSNLILATEIDLISAAPAPAAEESAPADDSAPAADDTADTTDESAPADDSQPAADTTDTSSDAAPAIGDGATVNDAGTDTAQ